MRPSPASVQATNATVFPSRDQVGNSSMPSASRVSRRGVPPAIGLVHSLPSDSNTTCRPSGDTDAKRGIAVAKRSGDTGTCGCGAAIAPRVSFTWNGISRAFVPSASTRLILPPAQNTTERLSGVQAMLGYTPVTAQVSCTSWSSAS